MEQTQDQIFIRETLRLAGKGKGWTNPNPMVGAVIVKDGRIIGKGWHCKAGAAHAESEAIKSSKESPAGATLYINLEPCSHFGRTPPCVDEIIRSKITRVVCSVLDPNPKVNGKGIAKLKAAGIDVAVGILEDEARLLNEAFFNFHILKRPFVALKFAASLDGKIASKTGDSKWITNEKARRFSRELRGEYQAILIGANTAATDDPHLGARIKNRKDPLKIVLDHNLKIPLESQLLRDANVLIVTTSLAAAEKIDVLRQKGTSVLVFDDGEIPLKDLLGYLKKREIISVLVEGGGDTIGRFVDEKLFDKVYAFYSPIIIGGKEAVNPVGGRGVNFIKEAARLNKITVKKFDDNLLITGYPAE